MSFPFEACDIVLGRGGSGTVYLGRNADTHEYVAVKRCYCSGAAARRLPRQQQQQQAGQPGHTIPTTAAEPALLAEVAMIEGAGPHPHLLPCLGSYTSPRRVTFFAMELMQSDVSREIRNENRAVRQLSVVRALAYSLLTALAQLHERGISHMDVKPGNILLASTERGPAQPLWPRVCVPADADAVQSFSTPLALRRGPGAAEAEDTTLVHACLGDFSAAYRAEPTVTTTTTSTSADGTAASTNNTSGGGGSGRSTHSAPPPPTLRGTLYYKAPEQLLGKKIDCYHACDMWALGCTLYEISAGRTPFSGCTELQVQMDIFSRMGSSFSDYPRQTRASTLFSTLPADGAMGLATTNAEFRDLLERLLVLEPSKRLTAREALQHPFVASLTEHVRVSSKLNNNSSSNGPTGANTVQAQLCFPLRLLYTNIPAFLPECATFKPIAPANARLRSFAPLGVAASTSTTVGTAFPTRPAAVNGSARTRSNDVATPSARVVDVDSARSRELSSVLRDGPATASFFSDAGASLHWSSMRNYCLPREAAQLRAGAVPNSASRDTVHSSFYLAREGNSSGRLNDSSSLRTAGGGGVGTIRRLSISSVMSHATRGGGGGPNASNIACGNSLQSPNEHSAEVLDELFLRIGADDDGSNQSKNSHSNNNNVSAAGAFTLLQTVPPTAAVSHPERTRPLLTAPFLADVSVLRGATSPHPSSNGSVSYLVGSGNPPTGSHSGSSGRNAQSHNVSLIPVSDGLASTSTAGTLQSQPQRLHQRIILSNPAAAHNAATTLFQASARRGSGEDHGRSRSLPTAALSPGWDASSVNPGVHKALNFESSRSSAAASSNRSGGEGGAVAGGGVSGVTVRGGEETPRRRRAPVGGGNCSSSPRSGGRRSGRGALSASTGSLVCSGRAGAGGGVAGGPPSGHFARQSCCSTASCSPATAGVGSHDDSGRAACDVNVSTGSTAGAYTLPGTYYCAPVVHSAPSLPPPSGASAGVSPLVLREIDVNSTVASGGGGGSGGGGSLAPRSCTPCALLSPKRQAAAASNTLPPAPRLATGSFVPSLLLPLRPGDRSNSNRGILDHAQLDEL